MSRNNPLAKYEKDYVSIRINLIVFFFRIQTIANDHLEYRTRDSDGLFPDNERSDILMLIFFADECISVIHNKTFFDQPTLYLKKDDQSVNLDDIYLYLISITK